MCDAETELRLKIINEMESFRCWVNRSGIGDKQIWQ